MSTAAFTAYIMGQIAPIVLGSYFGILIYGSTILQLVYYFVTYPKDRRLYKSLVSFIFVLDSVQLLVFIICIFKGTVVDWGNANVFSLGPEGDYFIRLLAGHTVPTVLSVPAIQAFWLQRIWILGKDMLPQSKATKMLLFGSLIILVLSECVAMTVFAFASTVLALRPPQLKLHTTITNSVMLVTDFVISTIMTIVLYRSRSGDHKTNALLKNLIIYVLANGSLSSAFLFANLFLFLHNPDAWSWIGIFFVYERLYVSSFLASLNIRRALHTPVQSMVAPVIGFSDSPSTLIESMDEKVEIETTTFPGV